MRQSKFSVLLSVVKQNSKASTPAEEPATKHPNGSPVPRDRGGDDLIADPYALAGQEVLSGRIDAGLWARALLEDDGEGGATKAAYIRLRVAQLKGAAEAKRLMCEAQRQEEEAQEARRVAKVRAFAAEQEVTESDAQQMLAHGIRKENGQFVLYLDGHSQRYVYDHLHYAVQYSKDWHKHRVPPPANSKI